jgi:rod shape-determining protein MreC
MPKTKGKRFLKLIYILVAAALLVLLTASGLETLRLSAARIAGDFFYPYLSVPAKLKSELSDKTLLMHNKATLAAWLRNQQKANRLMAVKAATAAELSVENEELRKLLRLSPRRNCRYLYAEILNRDPLYWKEHFTISKGAKEGITTGTPVFYVNLKEEPVPYLAGIVKNVSRHTAEVITVLSPEFRLSVFLPESQSFGFINGDSKGRKYFDRVTVDFLPVKNKYIPGAPALTTGFEKKIPSGIRIGTIEKVQKLENIFHNQMYLSAALKPAAQLSGMRFVILGIIETPTKETVFSR